MRNKKECGPLRNISEIYRPTYKPHGFILRMIAQERHRILSELVSFFQEVFHLYRNIPKPTVGENERNC